MTAEGTVGAPTCSYRTENRIAIRFAINRTLIRTGNRIRVNGPYINNLLAAFVLYVMTAVSVSNMT
jgi:hypothetical protein